MNNEQTKEETTMNEAEQHLISDESKKIPREAITGIWIDPRTGPHSFTSSFGESRCFSIAIVVTH
jgi:hypothetical protein